MAIDTEGVLNRIEAATAHSMEFSATQIETNVTNSEMGQAAAGTLGTVQMVNNLSSKVGIPQS